jgi:hypothetical protein
MFDRSNDSLYAEVFQPFVILTRQGCFWIRHPGQVSLRLLEGNELRGIPPAYLPREFRPADLAAADRGSTVTSRNATNVGSKRTNRIEQKEFTRAVDLAAVGGGCLGPGRHRTTKLFVSSENRSVSASL